MADERKIAGLPRNVAIVGGLGVVGVLGYLWWRNRQAAAADSSSTDSSSTDGSSSAVSPSPALNYGANADEIIATVNGPSVGEDDDDEPGKKPVKPKQANAATAPTSSARAATSSSLPTSTTPAGARTAAGPSAAPTRGPATRPPGRAPARRRRRKAAA